MLDSDEEDALYKAMGEDVSGAKHKDKVAKGKMAL